jgi:hypothetical protein
MMTNTKNEPIKVKDPRLVEADDELAMKVRNEKQEARMRQLQNERE